MSTPLLRTSPHWDLPDEDRLTRAQINKKLISRFTDHHIGLREVHLLAKIPTDDGVEVNTGTFQKLLMETGPGAEPPLTAEHLCRLTWLRCERFVRSRGHERVQFRVYLVGVADAKSFKYEFRFSINSTQVLEDPEEEEEDSNDKDSSGNKNPNADEDEAPDPNLPPLMVQPQGELVPSGGPHPMAPHINPQFIVSLQNNTLHLAKSAYQGSMRENRLLVQEMRGEMSELLSDVKGMATDLLRVHLDLTRAHDDRHKVELADARDERKALREELGKATKLISKRGEDFLEIAKHGWKAFQDGMQMKTDVVDERIRMTEHRESQEPPAPAGPSGFSSLLKSGAPFVFAGLSMMFRNRGDEQNADFTGDLAKRFAAASGDDEEDDDDEEEEEYVDAETVPPRTGTPGNGHARAPGNGASFVGHPDAPPRHPTPFADRIRVFASELEPDAFKALRSALPKPAWKAFEAACAAQVDSVAIANLLKMEKAVAADPMLMIGLAEHLSEDEVDAIVTLMKDVKKAGGRRRPPPRPRPAAPSAES